MMRKILLLLLALAVLAPAGAGAAFDANLVYGARGAAVTELQQFLRDQGLYNSPVTGQYFGLTQAAVRSFQTREGISPASGYFGPKTRARAGSLSAGSPAAAGTDLSAQLQGLLAQVARLQTQLTAPRTLGTSTPAASSSIIPGRSLVALNCYFRYLPTGEIVNFAKGSGAFIRPDGTILTARHLVDLQFSRSVDPSSVSERTAQNAVFDHCDVGQVPVGTVLPGPDDIRRVNPSVLVPVLGYKAQLAFVPSAAGLSGEEEQTLDFALLRVSGVSKDGPFFGITSLPATFEYAPLATGRGPQIGDEVMSFGFPGDATEARQSSFGTFYLLGSVGRVKRIGGGNLKFLNQPLLVNTSMEVRGGRSGSPLFFQGEITGVVTSHTAEDVIDSFSVSATAIRRTLQEANVAM